MPGKNNGGRRIGNVFAKGKQKCAKKIFETQQNQGLQNNRCGTRLAIVQKTSYRSNPEYEVIPVADLLEMLPNGTNPAKISAKDIEKITEKYKSSLSAPKAEVIPQNGRKKIFTAKLTKKGIVNYIKDITQPSASQKKTAKKEVDNR